VEDFSAMMGEGEDLEEFALRACREAQAMDRVRGDYLVQRFFVARTRRLRGASEEEYDERLHSIIRHALMLTGPLKPSTEYVGYF
jgi:hypothetical protein